MLEAFGERPVVALILGSGLGHITDHLEQAITFTTSEVAGYPASTVEGHQGVVALGRLAGRPVVVIRGRIHMYEGYAPAQLTIPVRLARALGAEGLVVTNAAGAINPVFRPGEIMLLSDHISFSTGSPLTGDPGAWPRFVDMSEPYCPEWRESTRASAWASGVDTQSGVYLWTMGPSYETRAEIRAFRRLGADAVGMSTVPEVIAARQMSMRVVGISVLTNFAAGLGTGTLSHEEVLSMGKSIRNRAQVVATAAVEAYPAPVTNPAPD